MGTAPRTSNGKKVVFNRKEYTHTGSGNFSLNVVNTFRIPQDIAKKLTAQNFTARIERFSWYSGWSENVQAYYTITYNPDTFMLTGTFHLSTTRADYYQNITYVSAFWVE